MIKGRDGEGEGEQGGVRGGMESERDNREE